MKKDTKPKVNPKNTTHKEAKKADQGVSKTMFSTTLLMKMALVAFSFILYGNTLKNGYSLDDLYVTYNNPMVKKGFEAIPAIFGSRYINLNAEEGGSMNFGYRPLTKAMFAVEHQLFGENPAVSHFINILLYAITMLLIFTLLKRLFESYSVWFAFLVTMVWAAHPVHTEVVASLKNREEIISFLFGLLAMRSFIKYAEKGKILSVMTGAIWFMLGIISKPSILPLFAAIPFTTWYFVNRDWKRTIPIILSMGLMLLLAVVFVKMYLPAINRPMLYFENPLAFEKNIFLHFTTGMYGLLLYLKLLVFPHPLLFYYGYNTIPVVGFNNVWVWISIVLHLAMLVYALAHFNKKHTLSYAVFFYLILISMYSNFVKPPAGIIAERFLYIASLGFSIALVYLIFKLLKAPMNENKAKKTYNVAFLLLLIVIPFTAKTVNRNKDWDSQLSLFSHDVKYLQNSAKANFIYATTLKTELIEQLKDNGSNNGADEKVNKIVNLLEQTVKVYPGYFEAWNSLGEMYAMMKHDNAKALTYFERAVKERPGYAAGWYNLGYIHFQQENYPEALGNFRQASKLDTTDMKALSNLAMCYHKTGSLDSAVLTNGLIIRRKPDIVIPYINNASFYLARHDSVNAVNWLEKAVVVKPDNPRVTAVLSRYFAGKGDQTKAAYYKELHNRATGKQQE